MMTQRAYFPMPNADYSPGPNCPIQLGQIITSPQKPNEFLINPLHPLPPLLTSKKRNWTLEASKTLTGNVGVYAKFLAQILGAGADGGTIWNNENSSIMQFRELDTEFFEPDEEYVTRSVERVKQYLKKNPRKSLYMITGVKIARGAAQILTMKRAIGGEVKLGVDTSFFSMLPLEVGPRFNLEKSEMRNVGFEDSTDFVFAYRLRRIIVTWRNTIRSKEYMKGMAGLMNPSADEEEKNAWKEDEKAEGEEEMEFAYVPEDDYGADGLVGDDLQLVGQMDNVRDEGDDGEEDEFCRFIIPRF